MKKIDVCVSPELLHLYSLEDKIVVVTDILRATSCMVTAFANGVKEIKTFANAEQCRSMKEKGYVIAGERNGSMIEGFDLGNSPLHYLSGAFENKNVAMTTTNGTMAIEASRRAREVIIGSFLNLTAVADYLKKKEGDILILCAGWKGKVNLEDTLYAGALVYVLNENVSFGCDAPQLARTLYQSSKDHLGEYLSTSSHVRRLKKLNIQKDIEFCLQHDEYDVVPVLSNDKIEVAV